MGIKDFLYHLFGFGRQVPLKSGTHSAFTVTGANMLFSPMEEGVDVLDFKNLRPTAQRFLAAFINLLTFSGINSQ